jgi:hypothetical protein
MDVREQGGSSTSSINRKKAGWRVARIAITAKIAKILKRWP